MTTTQEQRWLDRLDAVDPFFGDHDKLDELLETAPSESTRSWLANQINENKRFVASMTATATS
jgi:hypothetical protein